MSGRLEAIWLKRGRRAPMDGIDRVRAVAGRGLEGNANQGGKRQVTLLAREAWRAVELELGANVDPRLRRANLFLEGIDLKDSRGRVLHIGAVRIRVNGETRPCRLMEESHPGLLAALDPDWHAGAHGEVLDDGEVAIGDRVAWDSGDAAT